MKLRSVTNWTTRDGKRRMIRLYKAWRNMRDRIAGHNYAGNGSRVWRGLECGFGSFVHFRVWALRNGYSRVRCSLDRIDPEQGYTPQNCRWTTRKENSSYRYACRMLDRDSGL